MANKTKEHQPIRVTVAGNRVFLPLEEKANPGVLKKHETFEVAYRWVSKEYRPPLPLVVYTGRQRDGRLIVAGLSAPRVGLTENDLKELVHLHFYISPGGSRNPKREKVWQPVGMWLFRYSKMLIACLEGTEKRWLTEWLAEARKEWSDPNLYRVAGGYRKSRRTVAVTHKRKKPAWRPVSREKALQSFHLFRDEKSLKPPPAPRPVGVLISAGGGVAPSRGRAEALIEAEKKPNAARLDLPDRSDLHRLGYRIGGLSRRERWRILADEAVPRLGLEKVVRTIVRHRKRALSQSDGASRYAHAIGEWEHDLARLKKELYPNYRPWFVWPRAEP